MSKTDVAKIVQYKVLIILLFLMLVYVPLMNHMYEKMSCKDSENSFYKKLSLLFQIVVDVILDDDDTPLNSASQMGRAKPEHGSIAGSIGKRQFYKINPFHQSSLRTISKRRNNLSLPLRRRRSREDGLRAMDLLRSFYTLTQVGILFLLLLNR